MAHRLWRLSPWSAICKLETKESQWYNSVEVQTKASTKLIVLQHLRTKVANDVINPSQRARENEMRCEASVRHEKRGKFICLLFYTGPQRIG